MTIPSTEPKTTSIHPATEIGHLSLTVADLARSTYFYTEAIGLTLLQEDEGEATLGVGGTPLLILHEDREASPWPRGGQSYTGLYHFAILLPTRGDLGRWLKHWLDLGFPMPGAGDHLVSEALYIEDPDGHGIEIYRDRPREGWEWKDGSVRMAVDPVDIGGVLAEGERDGSAWSGLPKGTVIGHIHLQVGNIPQAEAFYRDVIGFDIVVRMPTALFVSAGGYHHHLGMNTWHSRGAEAAPAGTVTLRDFTIALPTEEARHAVVSRVEEAGLPIVERDGVVVVQDPWQNTIHLQIAPSLA